MKKLLEQSGISRFGAILLCLLAPLSVKADVIEFREVYDYDYIAENCSVLIMKIVCALILLHLPVCAGAYWRLCRGKSAFQWRLWQVLLLGAEAVLSVLLALLMPEPEPLIRWGSLVCFLMLLLLSVITGGWFQQQPDGGAPETGIGKWLRCEPVRRKVLPLILAGVIIAEGALWLSYYGIEYINKKHAEKIEARRSRPRVVERHDHSWQIIDEAGKGILEGGRQNDSSAGW